ncbi:prepilin-type N-terminal cleavage/methylation domain-containing protein [Lentisphaera marina]|uniref:prepilin-type N-terminal cleavage/methylation domain-containing protein n=1 Tax=Lentisphaera marina TaxID=1111041 RepID=UPI002366DC5B|nr:prepilin-type N-terminal cleavage/methylation domain-containing protein [Lentisphaera marina]MDD7984635.1 prepilin-type N-terminal cleavage/methylation domain-containing protein [Lentisphaera marina]
MKKQKFSLIELLVVIAIIGILSSLLLPTLGKARKKAQSSVCQNKLKQISTASFMYAEDNDDFAPLNDADNSEYWSKRMSQNSYLPEINAANSNENGSPYKCPNGVNLDTYYTNNYSQNYRLGQIDANGTVYTPYQLTSNHASQTAFYMDSWKVQNTLFKYNLKEAKIYDSNDQQAIARHEGKANIAYIDGHVSTLTGSQLLIIGSEANTTEFWIP